MRHPSDTPDTAATAESPAPSPGPVPARATATSSPLPPAKPPAKFPTDLPAKSPSPARPGAAGPAGTIGGAHRAAARVEAGGCDAGGRAGPGSDPTVILALRRYAEAGGLPAACAIARCRRRRCCVGPVRTGAARTGLPACLSEAYSILADPILPLIQARTLLRDYLDAVAAEGLDGAAAWLARAGTPAPGGGPAPLPRRARRGAGRAANP